MLKLESPSDRRLVSPVVKMSFKGGFGGIQQNFCGLLWQSRLLSRPHAGPAQSSVAVRREADQSTVTKTVISEVPSPSDPFADTDATNRSVPRNPGSER